MTKKQYISQLTQAGQGIRGTDVQEKDRAGVIGGLCEVIIEKDTVIADQVAVIAAKDADIARRAARKEKSARQRKGMTYRIPAGIPRREPVRHYPEGYSPETMVVIGWNKHETLKIEKPHMYVRQEWDAICKPAGAKPTDARTEIVEAAGSQNCLLGCIAGNSLMAVVVTDKWCNHLPEYRQVKRFAAMGVELSTTSVNRWQHALANRLFPGQSFFSVHAFAKSK